MHSHTVSGCAVSMQKDGLLPLNQHALQVIGDVAYHDYAGTGATPRNARACWRISATATSWCCATTAC